MRIDVPTLRCDRCGVQTQDVDYMATFVPLTRYHASGHDDWDLCPNCWSSFTIDFIGG